MSDAGRHPAESAKGRAALGAGKFVAECASPEGRGVVGCGPDVSAENVSKIETYTAAQQSALFLSAFFDELAACGVREVVVSPGSRSTPLSMVAYELSRRAPERMELYLDVDERGAAFFALGLAKSANRPVCLVCTSGTAVANYYPAVLEAESSRVPLIVLTGDRPPRLQNLGAPQTCDQLNAYGAHVRHFQQMPLPGARPSEIAFARQMAKTACLRATGPGAAGPVHLNFPFDEPLTPDLAVPGLFEAGRRAAAAEVALQAEGVAGALGSACAPANVLREAGALRFASPLAEAEPVPNAEAIARVMDLVARHRTLVVAGDGCAASSEDARAILAWARAFDLPVLADPLSGLRRFDDPLVIDCYDAVLGRAGAPELECVVRFGRYPVSKRCFTGIAAARPVQIVVDALDTTDFNCVTDLFVRCAPAAFARAATAEAPGCAASPAQSAYAREWIAQNGDASARIACRCGIGRLRSGIAAQQPACSENVSETLTFKTPDASEPKRCADGSLAPSCVAEPNERPVRAEADSLELSYAAAAIELAPADSLLFVANSMAVRLADAAYLKSSKRLRIMCNRGLNGIDGTVSTALGAAQRFAQTTLLTGDLTMLHDLNALALQRELHVHHGGEHAPSIVIVLLNNDGGGIFDLLPQRSSAPYFERLFLTPQNVSFEHAAAAFHVPYARTETLDAFARAYRAALGVPGISLIEVPLALAGLRERFGALS